MTTLRRFRHDESAQGLSEYSLILALVALALILILLLLRDSIASVFETIRNTFANRP